MTRPLVAAACGLAVALAASVGWFDALEWKTWDARLRLLGANAPPPAHVAILAIDQASLDHAKETMGVSWPWPRELYVPVVDYCRSAGAAGVVFDILFTESSFYGERDDAALAAMLSARRDVVLASDPSAPPVEPLRSAARALGNVSFVPDADGIFRRLPLAANDVPALAFAAYEELGGGASIVPPLDRNGSFVIRYAGPAGTVPSYSMVAAIQSFVREQEGGEIALDKGALRNRWVFLGTTAPGLLDLRPTPFSSVYPGVEVHATVLENLVTRRFVRTVPPAVDWMLILLPALTLGVLLRRIRSAGRSAIVLPVALLVLVAASAFAFRAGTWLPLAAPLAGTALSFVAVTTLSWATEGRQRRFLKHAFRHYLSPALIEDLLNDPSRLTLGGQRKELTILFSDLASFTSISEGLEPETLTDLLNRYLTAMTDVIHAEGGTVDKYEGDAIIAFWNAPVDQPDHAARGIRAALACQAELERMNPDLAKLAGRELEMRIGVHTGTVVVGNMGSRDRFDYTAIGDAANLASRLEGLCKVFRTPVLASADTIGLAGDGVLAREIGRVRVVGRSAPTDLFQPLAAAGDPRFAAALQAYYRGELSGAAGSFAELTDDPVAHVYKERCEKLAAAAPPASWDGVWEMRSK